MFGGQESRLWDEVHLGNELGPGDEKYCWYMRAVVEEKCFPEPSWPESRPERDCPTMQCLLHHFLHSHHKDRAILAAHTERLGSRFSIIIVTDIF